MKFFASIFSVFLFTFFAVTQCRQDSENYLFYMKVDSGISSSQMADVVAFYPPWNTALQGYDAKLGNCAITGFSIGCEFFHILDLEVGISNRSIFEYTKYQIATINDQSYTREFDLSVTPIMFTANILGRGIPHLHHDFHCGKIYPIFGAGVGTSNLLMTNFRTIGLPATGDSAPYESFTSENQYSLTKNFTYTLQAGIEYSHGDRWAFGTGYRWLNAGDFQSPQYVRSATGAAVDVTGNQWNIRFRANEWFIEFKIFI